MLAWINEAAAWASLESPQIGLILGQFGLEDLHGHATLQLTLFGQIDLGHRPPPQSPQEAKAPQLPAGQVGQGRRFGGSVVGVAHGGVLPQDEQAGSKIPA
jgi:hypothetical protein